MILVLLVMIIYQQNLVEPQCNYKVNGLMIKYKLVLYFPQASSTGSAE